MRTIEVGVICLVCLVVIDANLAFAVVTVRFGLLVAPWWDFAFIGVNICGTIIGLLIGGFVWRRVKA